MTKRTPTADAAVGREEKMSVAREIDRRENQRRADDLGDAATRFATRFATRVGTSTHLLESPHPQDAHEEEVALGR
jgi:hypothetical protein